MMVSLVLLTGIVFVRGIFYEDFIFIKDGKFMTAECNLNSLQRGKTGGVRWKSYIYQIRGLKNIGENDLYIKMDFYQYNKLLMEQKENTNKIIMIYYLPHSKRMLKVEK
jgi:hypothetical protein